MFLSSKYLGLPKTRILPSQVQAFGKIIRGKLRDRSSGFGRESASRSHEVVVNGDIALHLREPSARLCKWWPLENPPLIKWRAPCVIGAPGEIRTPDPLVRSWNDEN
jgi:hypothetical protein